MTVRHALDRGLRLIRGGRRCWLVRFRGQTVGWGETPARAVKALLWAATCVELCAEAGGQ